MAVSTRAIADVLAAIAGPGALREGREGEADGLTPTWVAAPRTPADLAAVVALARDEGLSVIPRGSGSAMAMGHAPARADIVVDLAWLDAILEYNADDLTVTAGAGITLGALAARLAPHGQWLPLDPPRGATRTLGGVTATNASGPLRARYGAMRDLLLGVRFVQADGVVTWGGARVVKSVTGYDIPKLMVGALGTLGVLTELTLRLHPVPACERTWVAVFGSAAGAQAFVAAVLDSTLQPSRLEWLNAAASRARGLDPGPAAVAIAVASVEAAVLAEEPRVAALARAAGGTITLAPVDLWERHASAVTSDPDTVVLRVTTLPSALAATVAEVERAVADGNGLVRLTGCAAMGTLRAEITGLAAPGAAGAIDRVRESLAAVDGSVVIERGPRALRAAVDPWGAVAEGPRRLMRDIKDRFDPRRVLNPGRFVGAR